MLHGGGELRGRGRRGGVHQRDELADGVVFAAGFAVLEFVRGLALDDGGGVAEEDFRGRLIHRVKRGVIFQAAVGDEGEGLHEAVHAGAGDAADEAEVGVGIQAPEPRGGRRHVAGGLAEEEVVGNQVALVRQLVAGELLGGLGFGESLREGVRDALGEGGVGLLFFFRRHESVANLVADEGEQFAVLGEVVGEIEGVETHVALLFLRAVAFHAVLGEEGAEVSVEGRWGRCGRGGSEVRDGEDRDDQPERGSRRFDEADEGTTAGRTIRLLTWAAAVGTKRVHYFGLPEEVCGRRDSTRMVAGRESSITPSALMAWAMSV